MAGFSLIYRNIKKISMDHRRSAASGLQLLLLNGKKFDLNYLILQDTISPFSFILNSNENIDRKIDTQLLMINGGGGDYCRRHWKTLDFPMGGYDHNAIFVDHRFDLMNGESFPFHDNSVAFFYSAHTLEHIPHEFCHGILDEICRCLEFGGVLRISLLDYDLVYRAYQCHDIRFFFKYPGETIEEKFLDFLAIYCKAKRNRH